MESKYMNNKTPKYYIEKIINDIEFCIYHLNGKSLDDFNNDEILNNAISFKLVQISENVKKLPSKIYELHGDIPWFKISGLRNRIVHDYGSVQLDIIFDTIKYDFPNLLEQITQIIK